MSEILHVSDTALMVAACRAMETVREGGLVNDPFAARLAGERGMAIAQALPMLKVMCFGVGVRSRFLDELVLHTVTELGARTVVNLGAGLDTRPWRLALPSELRWVEVDFPAMLEYKAGTLAGEQPGCRWEQMAADLADEGQRRQCSRRPGLGQGW
ncbi:MAG: class I SAM-dependent methyltransferase [Bryobacterales bacterium]|nr:class I SAM-dependent methyltransferase [Bryobacterales bacterium]